MFLDVEVKQDISCEIHGRSETTTRDPILLRWQCEPCQQEEESSLRDFQTDHYLELEKLVNV